MSAADLRQGGGAGTGPRPSRGSRQPGGTQEPDGTRPPDGAQEPGGPWQPGGPQWPDLVAAALLGVERCPVPGGAAALLDAAAVATVRRRAGRVPLRAGAVPDPAPGDERPVPAPAAVRRLELLLGRRPGGAGPADLTRLLPQWLAAASAAGYRLPPALVPDVLAAARARSELRTDAVALAGPLGRWLAARNEDWAYVLRTAEPDSAAGRPRPSAAALRGPAPAGDPGGGGRRGTASDCSGSTAESPGLQEGTGPADSTGGAAEREARIWRDGLFTERVTLLTRLRRRDPGAALDLLRSTWPQERAADRLLFLDALQERLSPADEPFLEAALNDRGRGVRATAAELLSALPGSALGARMAERAAAAVRLERGRIVVLPPRGCDAAMQRDGIAPVSPTGRGERAWWLAEVVAAAPLTTWVPRLAATPAEVLRLPVADGWRDELREAWARAAVRQGSAEWARALLGPGVGAAPAARLLLTLPAGERAAWTAAFIRARGLADSFQALAACAAPWSGDLGAAVLGALARAAEAGAYPWSHSGVLGAAERALPTGAAAEAERLAEEAGPASPWAETFTRLAATLRFREAMLDELG